MYVMAFGAFISPSAKKYLPNQSATVSHMAGSYGVGWASTDVSSTRLNIQEAVYVQYRSFKATLRYDEVFSRALWTDVVDY